MTPFTAAARASLVLWLLVACVTVQPARSISLFLRTGWLSTLPEEEWRAWFELIKRGRAEGPTSPYYVEDLGLQSVACCDSPAQYRGCLGPKCSQLGLAPHRYSVEDAE